MCVVCGGQWWTNESLKGILGFIELLGRIGFAGLGIRVLGGPEKSCNAFKKTTLSQITAG